MLPLRNDLPLSAEARKFLVPAPEPARMMAARGLAPLAPVELLQVQVLLSEDEAPSVAQAAAQSLQGLPESMFLAAIPSISDGSILDRIARCPLTAKAKEALLLNRAVADETLVHVATAEKDDKVLDILAGNQARMMNHAPIAEAMLENPHVSFATKRRLEEFFLNDYAARILDPGQEAPQEAADTLAADFAAALAVAPAGGVAEVEALSPEELARELLEEKPDDAPAAPVEEAKKNSLYKTIIDMKVSGKIKLALKGNKEARSILIKDANKLVSGSVLKNPRISDGEVVAVANSKSASEDLLRIIAANSQWMSLYAIRSGLVHNSKTPPAIAMKLLPTLSDAEIAKLTKSKGVSGAVSTAAKRLMNAKAKRK